MRLACLWLTLATVRCRLYTFHPDDGAMHFERLKRQAPVTSTPPARLPRPPPQIFDDNWKPNVRNDDGSDNSDGIPTRFDDPSDDSWKDAKEVTISHDYYNETVLPQLSDTDFGYYWHELHASGPLGTHYTAEHNVHEFVIKEGVPQAKVEEPHELKDSYRRAVNVPISFKFPFYGVPTRNVTIATGGFCYIGENSHSWLAATQYIAPLMANFATDDDNSTIVYEETRERMVIQWHDVMLKDKRSVRFTFQTSLWANGSIWFAYKKVGAPVSQVSDFHHPRKVGLSDAYLESPDQSTGSKRIIHEYHRIEIKFDKIENHTVIMLDPLPTCMTQTSCETCNDVVLPSWNCTWCEASPTLSFCSDEDGKHRMNEQFHKQCAARQDMGYCSNTSTTVVPSKDVTSTPKTTTQQASRKAADREVVPGGGESAASSTMLLVMLAVVAMVTGVWLGYAYLNPQSRSGQCLIRYRPSRWRMPNSDVRYTASVHM